jgi:hypothetical protein
MTNVIKNNLYQFNFSRRKNEEFEDKGNNHRAFACVFSDSLRRRQQEQKQCGYHDFTQFAKRRGGNGAGFYRYRNGIEQHGLHGFSPRSRGMPKRSAKRKYVFMHASGGGRAIYDYRNGKRGYIENELGYAYRDNSGSGSGHNDCARVGKR